MIQNAFAAYHKQQAKSDIMPLSMCVAMSQGYIGYDLQNMIGEELDRRGLGIHCATVLRRSPSTRPTPRSSIRPSPSARS